MMILKPFLLFIACTIATMGFSQDCVQSTWNNESKPVRGIEYEQWKGFGGIFKAGNGTIDVKASKDGALFQVGNENIGLQLGNKPTLMLSKEIDMFHFDINVNKTAGGFCCTEDLGSGFFLSSEFYYENKWWHPTLAFTYIQDKRYAIAVSIKQHEISFGCSVKLYNLD